MAIVNSQQSLLMRVSKYTNLLYACFMFRMYDLHDLNPLKVFEIHIVNDMCVVYYLCLHHLQMARKSCSVQLKSALF
jgi:hypothetical protein